LKKNKKLLYWLCFSKNPLIDDRVRWLESLAYDVSIFETFEEFNAAMAVCRSACVILSDNSNVPEVKQAITAITSNPEHRSCRLVLVTETRRQEIKWHAAASGFRDIIPIRLEKEIWLSRFKHAVTNLPQANEQIYPKITSNTIAALNFPARIVWVGEDRALIESRLQPKPGTQLVLKGPLVQAMGLKTLLLEAKSFSQVNLDYRFSGATEVRWKIPQHAQARFKLMWNKLSQSTYSKRIKVFVALHDRKMRSSIVSKLDRSKFEVCIPLSKSNLVREPEFFGPDIIILEQSLCVGSNQSNLEAMLNGLQKKTPIFLIGPRTEVSGRLLKLDPSIRLIEHLPIDLDLFISDEVSRHSESDSSQKPQGVNYISHASDLSFCELQLSARITELHPEALQIALPCLAGRFALVQVEVPVISNVLGFTPFIKLGDVGLAPRFKGDAFAFRADARFSDLNLKDRKIIALSVAKAVYERLVGTGASKKFMPAESHGISNNTEFGPGQPNTNDGYSSESQEQWQQSAFTAYSDPETTLNAVAQRKLETDTDEVLQEADLADDDTLATVVIDWTKEASQRVIAILTNRSLLYLGVFILFSTTFLLVAWLFLENAQKHYEKSGKQYTEPLKKIKKRHLDLLE
jgi:hypothetical protein